MNTPRILIGSLALTILAASLQIGCVSETEPESFTEALALASRTQLPLLIEFYSDG